MKICEWHQCTNEAKRKYCSDKCKAKAGVHRYRKNLKQKAVDYKGGACAVCGYDKCVDALEFHHLDPTEKDFGIGSGGHTRRWVDVVPELDKCVMLCANCHREVHSGLRTV
jgi:hypothetical protein